MRRPMKATRLLPGVLLGGAMVALLSCTEPAPLGVARHELAPPLPPGGSLEPSLLPCCPPLAYTTPDLAAILDYLPSMDDADSKTVTGHLKHFSDYAVAW